MLKIVEGTAVVCGDAVVYVPREMLSLRGAPEAPDPKIAAFEN